MPPPSPDEDKKFHKVAAARNQADALMHSTQKNMTELGDKLPAEPKASIEAVIKELEAAVKGDDADVLEQKTKELTDAASKLSEFMGAQRTGEAGAGEAEAEAKGSDDKDAETVDAEFEEVDADDAKDAKSKKAKSDKKDKT